MATGNILSAQINVTAPGAKEAFEGVAKSTLAVNDALKQLGAQGALNTKSVADAMVKLKTIIASTSDPAQLQKLNIAMAALQNTAKNIPPTLDKVNVSSLRASSSALNLSHSLGLIPAESSHLTHGLESIIFSFERMKEQTGSTEGGLKELASVVGGGLGLSLLITGISFLAEKFIDTVDATKESEDALKGFESQIDNVKDSVKGLANQLQFLNELAGINIKISGLGDLVKLQGESTAQRQLISDLSDQRQKLLDIGTKIVESETLNGEDLIKAQKKNADEIKSVDEQISQARNKQTIIYRQIAEQRVEDQKDADKKAEEARKKYLAQLKADLEFEEAMWKNQADKIKKIFDQKFNTTDLDQKTRIKVGVDINEDPLATDFGEKFQVISKDIQARVKALTESNPILIRAHAQVELTIDQKKLIEFIQNVNTQVKSLAVDLVSSAAESIGEALAGGDIMKGLQSFVNTIASALASIGKQFIAIGITAQIAQKALAFLFEHPALAIAAGIALEIAAGALRKSISGGVKGFVAGGYTGAGGKYEPAGIVHKGEYVIPAHAVQRLGIQHLNNLAFGNNIRGYASGGFVTGGIPGNGCNVQVSGQFRIIGNDLVLVLANANRSQGRLT